jgi:hypothetical protein
MCASHASLKYLAGCSLAGIKENAEIVVDDTFNICKS